MTDEEINPTNPPSYSYSTDEELFDGEFASPEAAAEAAFYDNPEIERVLVGENHPVTAHRYVSADRILEDVTERALDESGDAAEDWLRDLMRNYAKQAELQTLVGDWLQSQEPPSFGRITNVRQITRREMPCVPQQVATEHRL